MNNIKYNCSCNHSKKKAFTLIELLIVIAIIGILFIVLVSKVDFATDKAKTTGVQTDFRSFQLAFNQVAQENAGFNTFGFNTGDNADAIPSGYAFINENAKNATMGDGIRNSYDQGDKNLNGKQDVNGVDGYTGTTEVFTGRKIYTESWTEMYTLVKPGTTGLDADAIFALETAINKNLDPKLHITINADGKIAMANQARDPWKNEYHGVYISQAERDHGADRGAIIIYSNGANGKFGSAHDITNGVVTVTVPGNNVNGKDDMSIVSCYTYFNGFGEVLNITTGFSSNQTMSGSSNTPQASIPGDDQGSSETPDNVAVAGATFTDGVTLTWEELKKPENGTKYTYVASKISDVELGAQAFAECRQLVSITIPEGVEKIGVGALQICENLVSVQLPSTLKEIGISAFNWDQALLEIEIPDGVEVIGDSAFRCCSSLFKANIPNALTEIPKDMFTQCVALTELTMGNKVEIINDGAFFGCAFASLTLPETLTAINGRPFMQCNSLYEIINKSTLNINLDNVDDFGIYTSPIKAVVKHEEQSILRYLDDFVFYENTNGTVYLVKYAGMSTTVELPNYGFDYIVAAYSFYSNPIVECVIVPDNVIELQNSWSYNANIKEVTWIENN